MDYKNQILLNSVARLLMYDAPVAGICNLKAIYSRLNTLFFSGTMDIQATKLMSIHLEPLLPPTSIELDIQQNILVAALLGVGLLYQGSEHHHYAQALLHEIGLYRFQTT